MIYEMNPVYDEVLVLDYDDKSPFYYLLYANRKNVVVDNVDVIEDDCMIAYSDESHEEISNHRNKLITNGYYKSVDLYITNFKNIRYKQLHRSSSPPNTH